MPSLRLLARWAALLAWAVLSRGRAAEPVIEEGELAGAHYAVARPPGAWNHRLLLVAHDLRRADAPLLPGLAPLGAEHRALLGAGWLVAATSFRRNGMILADAMADLDLLRAQLVAQFGEPERVFLEGDGMGGLVVTLMAERPLDLYAGALAVGATLAAKEDNMAVGLSLQPKIPLLFVANRNDTRGVTGYVTARMAHPTDFVPPALFVIDRDGRANVNQAERLAALRTLVTWVDEGRQQLPVPPGAGAYFDGTIAGAAESPRALAETDGKGFRTSVTSISAVTGDAVLAATAADFAAAGIAPMMYFRLRIGRAEYRVLYGRDVTSVRRGEWVAFPEAEGRTQLTRREADAAATAHLAPGDQPVCLPYEAGGAGR